MTEKEMFKERKEIDIMVTLLLLTQTIYFVGNFKNIYYGVGIARINEKYMMLINEGYYIY